MTWISRGIAASALLWSAAGLCAPAHGQNCLWAPELRLDDADLARQSGGFEIAGLNIQLGAEIRSYLGDQLVMQTNVSWTSLGGNVAKTYFAGLTPATADAVRTELLTGSGVRFGLGADTVLLANQGQTAFIQRSAGTLQNIIINTASNVKLNQIINAKLDISGYSLFRNGVVSARIGWTLAAMG